MVIPADCSLATMAANLIYEEAAPYTEGSTYALGLIRTAGVRRGQAVLVYGATGGHRLGGGPAPEELGARVMAVCATAHLELARGLGAARVIDYTVQDFTKDDQRYDVVFDAVGNSTFGRCRRLLKSGGRYLTPDSGPLWQNLFLALVTPFIPGVKKVILPTLCRKSGDGDARQAADRVRRVQAGY